MILIAELLLDDREHVGVEIFRGAGGAADHDFLRLGAHDRRHADRARRAEAALAFKRARRDIGHDDIVCSSTCGPDGGPAGLKQAPRQLCTVAITSL